MVSTTKRLPHWFLWALLNFSMFPLTLGDLPWERAPCWSLWPAETWGESRWISSRPRTARRSAALPSGGWCTAWAAPSRPAVRWAEVRSCCPQVRLHVTAGAAFSQRQRRSQLWWAAGLWALCSLRHSCWYRSQHKSYRSSDTDTDTDTLTFHRQRSGERLGWICKPNAGLVQQ